MEFIAHRGFWKNDAEKNSVTAFKRALENGFGIETDLRDYDGKLVISHDIAQSESLSFDEFLALYNKIGSKSTLALNIKSDGLQALLEKSLKDHEIDNYFVFDMSIPDSLHYFKKEFVVYERLSEYETVLAFQEKSAGIWLDAFQSEWYLENLEETLSKHKATCIVSSELHKRDHQLLWKTIKDLPNKLLSTVSLCTDFPDKAREYFL